MVKLISILLFTLLLWGCESEDPDIVDLGVITNVSGPASGEVNEDIIFKIDFYAINGCGSFHSITCSQNGNRTFVQANVKYSGSVCPDILIEFQEDFVFRTTQVGVYTLVFNNSFYDDITYTITIN
jgi:hypothetical protein